MATFEEAFKTYQDSGRGQTVSGMYDAQRNAELAGLKTAYDQNVSNHEAAKANISNQYRASYNDLHSQFERNRRNNNMSFAANGLNTGAVGQAQLAQASAYQRDYGALRGKESQDIAEAERGLADLKVAYQNAIQQANANGDYKKMAALLDDYNTQYNTLLQQAQTLASYGDFSGYSAIPGYTDQQIGNMRSSWIAQNPLLAYNTGAITADQYYKMTGQYAPGTAPSGGGYGYSGSSGKSGSGKTNQILDPGIDPNDYRNWVAANERRAQVASNAETLRDRFIQSNAAKLGRTVNAKRTQ